MHRAGNKSVRHADQLAFQHMIADLHHRFRGFAGMLVQRNDQPGRQRRLRDWRSGGLRLVAGRMDAAVEMIKFSHRAVAVMRLPSGHAPDISISSWRSSPR